jgi:hypothetical protein
MTEPVRRTFARTVNKQMVTNNVTGYMWTMIVYFLMNIHITPRTIYLSRVCTVQFQSGSCNPGQFRCEVLGGGVFCQLSRWRVNAENRCGDIHSSQLPREVGCFRDQLSAHLE